MLVTFCPLTETLVVFQELMKPPRLAACQQNWPAPSKVNGIVMVEVTGVQAPPVGWVGVKVADGPAVGVGVRVAVFGGIPMVGVLVTVCETTGVIGVLVRVELGPAVEVRVRVELGPAVGVRVREGVGVGVGVQGKQGQVGLAVNVGVRVGVA
jgi:hypothetical protein